MAQEPLTDAYSELKEKLHAMAIGMLHSDSEAMDAVHDAFCNLWKQNPPQSHSEAKFKLIAVMRNVCLNKLKRQKPVNGYNLAIETTSADQQPMDSLKTLIPQLLAPLPPLQRKVFELAVFHDYEYSEIASELNISIEAVRMNMSRARIKVREQYQKLTR